MSSLGEVGWGSFRNRIGDTGWMGSSLGNGVAGLSTGVDVTPWTAVNDWRCCEDGRDTVLGIPTLLGVAFKFWFLGVRPATLRTKRLILPMTVKWYLWLAELRVFTRYSVVTRHRVESEAGGTLSG